jgi:hypothetical protein
VRLARTLRGNSVRFLEVREFRAASSDIQPADRVCLVMLNWLHACAPEEALALMLDHVRATGAAHVLFDTIHESVSGYRYKHSSNAFAAVGEVQSVDDGGDLIRSIVTLRVSAANGAV